MYYYYTHTYNTHTHMMRCSSSSSQKSGNSKMRDKKPGAFLIYKPPSSAMRGLFMSLLLYLSNARDFYIYIARTHYAAQQQWEKTHARRQLTLIYARRGELAAPLPYYAANSQPNGMHGRCAHTPFIYYLLYVYTITTILQFASSYDKYFQCRNPIIRFCAWLRAPRRAHSLHL